MSLKLMFKKQEELQQRLGTFPLTNENKQEFINIQTLALLDEVHEALRETPWKPWKKNKLYNEQLFQEEIVDVWHFLINLTIASGLNHETIVEKFLNKNKENHKRQDGGY
jgi:dimeric dUTPase (all-alpha-NTP-PPase superfamily)